MGKLVQMINLDARGEKLFIKEFDVNEKGEASIKYKVSVNDMPFEKVPLFEHEGSYVITDVQGKVLYRIHPQFLQELVVEFKESENERIPQNTDSLS